MNIWPFKRKLKYVKGFRIMRWGDDPPVSFELTGEYYFRPGNEEEIMMIGARFFRNRVLHEEFVPEESIKEVYKCEGGNK